MLKIENDFLTASFNLKGAELSSLRTKEIEYLWNRDPAYWAWQAPLLFPIIGKLKDDKTLISGKYYSLTKHGFIRDLDFETVSLKKDEIIFRNTYSQETLQIYPYKYQMDVIYKLEGKSLVVIYKVMNHDTTFIPFNIGVHPGINCPLYDGESFEDYAIHFEKEESFSCPKIEANGLINLKETVCEYWNLKKLDLKHEIFNIDTIVIMNVKSKWAALLNKKGKGLKIYFSDFKTFAIWSPYTKKAPFVCLEPWIGYADTADSDFDFLKKADLIFLEPGNSVEFSYKMQIID